MFVYGLLKQGELGHRQIEEFLIVDKPVREVTVPGLQLLILDGLAYAIRSDASKRVSGQLLHLRPEAYDSIIRFENHGAPEPKYVWDEIQGDFGLANILVSSVSNFRSRHHLSGEWSILDDKFYVEGMPWVRTQIQTIKLLADDSHEKRFLALAAFWITAVTFERTLKFCFGIPPLGDGVGIRSRIKNKVLNDTDWVNAYTSVRTSKSPSLETDDMDDFFQSWNDFRNDVKGKPEAFSAVSIASKTGLMVDFLENLLRNQSPRLAAAWSRQSDFLSTVGQAQPYPHSPSKLNFVDDGLKWCSGRLSELRSQYESSNQYAEGDGAVSLQATFLVVWAIFEALLSSTYPNFRGSGHAISNQLSGDPRWAEAIQMQGQLRVSWVWSQFNPLMKPPSDYFCFSAWQEIRKNVIHRGKSAIPEFKLVLEATEQMVKILLSFSGLLDSADEPWKGE